MQDGRDVEAGAGSVAGVRFLHRVLVRQRVGDRSGVGVGRAPTWVDLLSAAITVGVASGLLELGLLFAQVRGLNLVDWSTLMVSRHAGWMIPATGAAVDVLLAMVLVAPAMVRASRKVRRNPIDDVPGPAWGWAGTVLGTLLLLGPLLAIRGFHPIAPLALSMGVGYRVRRLIVRPTPGWRRKVRWAAGFAVGVLGLLLVGRSGATSARPVVTRPGPGRPDVIWIVADTLRADRMSVYGYGRPTTPALESWARAGITFEWAYSAAPWTLPSHISMFTGLLPSEHGSGVDRPYTEAAPTVAEHLRARGYETAGIVANVRMCNRAYGVGRGFAHYEDYPWRDEVSLKAALSNSALGATLTDLARRFRLPVHAAYPFDYKPPASDIAARARAWLGSRDVRDAGAPFFLFLNFMDAHGPYLPSTIAAGRFWHGPAPQKGHAGPGDGWRALQARDAADAGHRADRQRELDAASRRLGDLYDECIAGLDAELGRFLSELRDEGRLARTWVVITADHGEHFGEHGQFGHGSSLYNEVTHVPLIVIPPMGDGRSGDPYPGLRGRRVDVPVSLRDLPATVAEATMPGEPSPFPGRSLARYWNTGRVDAPDPVFAELDSPRLKGDDFRSADVDTMESIIDEDRVLIEYRKHRPELFDLPGDPRQEHNLADRPEEAPRQRRMKGRLDGRHHRAASTSG